MEAKENIELVPYSLWWRIFFTIMLCMILFLCVVVWGQNSDIMARQRGLINYYTTRFNQMEEQLADLQQAVHRNNEKPTN